MISAEQVACAQRSAKTIEYVLPRMVKIFGAGGIKKLYSYETGFLVSPQGHIVTVWSHVLDRDEVVIVLNDGRRFTGSVVAIEPKLDLAVLKLQGEDLDLPYFKLNEMQTASPGRRILAFSNMYKVATGNEPVSVLHGVIAARTKLDARRGMNQVPYEGTVYIVDAVTNNSGAGGGLITTYDGKLLGVIGKQLRNTRTNTWVNYAIPLQVLQKPIQQMIDGTYKYSSTDEKDNPNQFKPIDFGIVMIPNIVYKTPSYIDKVVSGSSAEKAGLKKNDLIVFVNDELVQSNRNLLREFNKIKPGDRIDLVVRRENKLVTISIPVSKK